MDISQPTPQNEKNVPAKSRTTRKLSLFLVVCIIILLAAGGYLAWALLLCQNQHTQDATHTKTLQAQVDSLAKQLQAAQAIASPGAKTPVCSPTVAVTEKLKENLSDAISSKNTAALEGYMASSVNVVYAASEKSGFEPPTTAVADLDYLNKNATGPWDFHLSKATLDTFKAGIYNQSFFGTTYAGESGNKYVIVYGFDSCAKINMIFVAAS